MCEELKTALSKDTSVYSITRSSCLFKEILVLSSYCRNTYENLNAEVFHSIF